MSVCVCVWGGSKHSFRAALSFCQTLVHIVLLTAGFTPSFSLLCSSSPFLFFLSVQHCLLFSVVYATGSWGAEERGSLVMGPTFGVSMPCSWTVTNTETQVQAAIPIRILLCTFIHLYNLSIINVSIYFNIHNDQ